MLTPLGLTPSFGSALAQYGTELKAALVKYDDVYFEGLKAHFEKHLDLLKEQA